MGLQEIDTRSGAAPELMGEGSITVILPCFNERDNIADLVHEIADADAHGRIKRIIFVDDDSSDGTSEYVKTTAFPIETLCLLRIGRQGLSSAVIEGMLLADTGFIAVMDADGQHLPSDLFRLVSHAETTGANLVIGSRFKDSEAVISHSGFRYVLSRLGNELCVALLRKRLTDPLTGFFLIEREALYKVIRKLHPSGFKILLEILYALRASDIRVSEIQINFRPRRAGESKLDSAVILDFVEQVANLGSGGLFPPNFLGFALVGASGLLVHFAVLYVMISYYHYPFLPSQSSATLVAMVSNYTLNNELTFHRNRRRGSAWLKGLVSFISICGLGAAANIGVSSVFNQNAYEQWESGLAGVVVGIVFNFALSKVFVWKR
jgi:dolichol-phosphate mannosyltransferase